MDDIIKFSSGELRDIHNIIRRIDRWRDEAGKPIQIKILYKNGEFTCRLPVRFGRLPDSDCFQVVARNGAGIQKELTCARAQPCARIQKEFSIPEEAKRNLERANQAGAI